MLINSSKKALIDISYLLTLFLHKHKINNFSDKQNVYNYSAFLFIYVFYSFSRRKNLLPRAMIYKQMIRHWQKQVYDVEDPF